MGVGYYDKTSILQDFKKWEPQKLRLETNLSFKNFIPNRDELIHTSNAAISLLDFSPRPAVELDAAALKLQKVYKSYRTRRNLADCAVVVEELWWKALDFATLKQSSISFFTVEEPESAVSRWARARTRVAKVAKGLSKNEKAQKLALRHWLEAIDPRHRYGHNLNLYYDVWFVSQSRRPFFYWLDVGDGREVNLEKCPRTKLQRQCITYLGPAERTAYEVIIHNGKLVYKQTREFLNTVEGSKWIFVLSTSRNLYVAEKKKGHFQHSSFLAGGATTAAGRMVASDGVLEAIWPYSGHYHPTEENFMEFISFLEEHQVDLSNVKRCAIDDDDPSLKVEVNEDSTSELPCSDNNNIQCGGDKYKSSNKKKNMTNIKLDTCWANEKTHVFELPRPLSSKWTTGAGPRIGCVREYPTELQFQALEQVNLSPRLLIMPGPASGCIIPSPRPSPKLHLSSRVASIGLPSPRMILPSTN